MKPRQRPEERRTPSQRLKRAGRIVAELPRSGRFGAGKIEIQRFQMGLDVTHSFELQQLFFLNANAEARISLDQNFIEAQGIDPDVFHQAGVRSDD